ncbi:stage III sporulation protein AH [Oxobacter pfennigii]|uniref:Stage III sporulation protein AH n=1 Tax=Oxobacter pfennigii TaxID=36849 RepID=A0A0P8YCM4_9CLOT|nr:SpoIIIAH-like family protein [Oxobacter pfennigii]KPU44916.1 stage III sporulation protein AH [Oxobacter pfennigii]
MVLRKKTIIILTLVLLIAAAGFVSTKYGKVIKVDNDTNQSTETGTVHNENEDDTETSSITATGYFIDVKLGRENQRTVDKQTLTEVINNANTSKEAKQKAETQLLSLVDISEKEMIIEALIKAKGFEDAVVFLSSDSANVTVKSKEVNTDTINQIKNIVCKESALPATKVMIQPKE